MKKVTIHNPKVVITEDEVFKARGDTPEYRKVESPGQDIENYPIEEATFDEEGFIIKINKPPFYKVTGRTLEWSIKKGETERFPEYVADVLLSRYPFLEKINELEETKEMEPTKMEDMKEAKPTEGSVHCKICGRRFKSVKSLGLHTGHTHPESLL